MFWKFFIEKYFNENITLCRIYSVYMWEKLKLQFIASKSEGIRNKSQTRIIYRYWSNWRFVEHAKRHQAWMHYVCMYMCVYIQIHIFTHIHAHNVYIHVYIICVCVHINLKIKTFSCKTKWLMEKTYIIHMLMTTELSWLI